MRFTAHQIVFGVLSFAAYSVASRHPARIATTSAPCTTTLFDLQPFEFGPTDTVYSGGVVTKTVDVDCGGCSLELRGDGIGPEVIFTTTTTVPGTRTIFTTVCATSPTSPAAAATSN